MPKQPIIRDAWLLPILKQLLPPPALDAIERAVADSYWSAAVRAGVMTDEQVLQTVARQTRMAVAPALLSSDGARALVPERFARRYGVLPLSHSAGTLDVATGNPYDLDCEQTLGFVSGRRVRMALASPMRIAERLDDVYAPQRSLNTLLAGVGPVHPVEAIDEAVPDEQGPAVGSVAPDSGRKSEKPIDDVSFPDRSVIQLVDHVVSRGIAVQASDIHLEAEEDAIVVRYRVDGLLRQSMTLPRAVGTPLVSRIKIMARLDIADRLRPQGGRARVVVDGAPIDLRVSTLPAAHGEKVVIRILDPRGAVQSLDALGVDPDTMFRLRRLLDVREGLVLVTGPTGSGKTTTLYAALHYLLRRGVNIITVEDPVEYRVPGIVQVQVNDKAGLTFAAALRSILRQDPDVVLVGEVRDRETAAIAIQAALTGHLVFATLHTIDACSSITRLHDLGVEPAKVAAALKGVIAQRLVRRLCDVCATPSNEAVPPVLWNLVPSGAGLRAPGGCPRCGDTGYTGRLAVMELLLVDDTLERLIATAAPAATLVTAARAGGTSSLWEGGVTQLLRGTTSVGEITRALEPDDCYATSDRRPPEDDPPLQELIEDPFIDRRSGAQYDRRDSILPSLAATPMIHLTVGVVDVYVLDISTHPWRVLSLQRAPDTIRPESWEGVHGKIDEGEAPEQAALREVREETGLEVQRLYNVTVHAFYLHASTTVQMAVVFCACVDSTQPVTLSEEHQRFEWLSLEAASERFLWPRARHALRDIAQLLRTGDAGAAEDVLRVR